MSVYKVIELVGTSDKSWEDAARQAINTASKTLKDLRIAEVVSQDLKIEDGNIITYRVRLSLSFRYKEE
jgi:flavin-binding protein dodecin